MWCKNCGQDVPGISDAGRSQIRCAGCGGALATDGEPGTAHYVEPAEALAEPQDEPLVDALDTAHEADPGVDGFEWPLRTHRFVQALRE